MQTLLDIRNDATIRSYSDATHGLLDAAKCSREEALVMVELAQRTKRDSRAMRIATIVAMLYLPGTFVAVCFNFLNKQHKTRKKADMITDYVWDEPYRPR